MACHKFINDFSIITQSGEQVPVGNAQVVLYNTGQSIALINGILPIMPGQEFTFPGAMNVEEIDNTTYTVVFSDNSVQNQLVVIRKLYRL